MIIQAKTIPTNPDRPGLDMEMYRCVHLLALVVCHLNITLVFHDILAG